jgi:hypothetical protein
MTSKNMAGRDIVPWDVARSLAGDYQIVAMLGRSPSWPR